MYRHNHTITINYLKPVDGSISLQAMISESCEPPDFYPGWFGELLDRILKEF